MIKIEKTIIIKIMIDKRIILEKLKASLVAEFGEDIDDVILFGSQVSGEAHKNSDYDVLIILNRDYDWEYRRKIISTVYDMELEYEIFIDMKLISIYELNHTMKGMHPIYAEAIEKGIHA